MNKEFIDQLSAIPDEVLQHIMFSAPWQSGDNEDVRDVAIGVKRDIDGAPYSGSSEDFRKLQALCFDKFETNPQIFTSLIDLVGRLTGFGFEMSSKHFEINQFMDSIYKDFRNRLPLMMPKYALRAKAQGELFLVFTVHDNGFIEIDFREPFTVRGLGPNDSGIIFHPKKAHMPLLYQFNGKIGTSNVSNSFIEQIPSIYMARYPELWNIFNQYPAHCSGFRQDLVDENKYSGVKASKFKKTGGFYRFVVQWDMSNIKERNVSQVRTTLKWVNYYEDLKKYEIDHKRSSGAYLWTITFDDIRAFREWISLTDEERRKTGIMAKKTPGGTIVLPPGMKMEVRNPTLPNISGSDTDILQMVVSGLNNSEDMIMGSNTGSYASVKASRPPQTDRVSNELSYWDQFLRYDFWDNIFFLSSCVSDFQYELPVRKCIGFRNQKEVFKKVMTKASELVEINFPVSEVGDLEARTRALLGVKHGSLNSTMGIPNSSLAKRLGIGNYHKARLEAATEDEMYPELQPEVDQSASSQESVQEGVKGATEKKPVVGRKRNKPVDKPEDK